MIYIYKSNTKIVKRGAITERERERKKPTLFHSLHHKLGRKQTWSKEGRLLVYNILVVSSSARVQSNDVQSLSIDSPLAPVLVTLTVMKDKKQQDKMVKPYTRLQCQVHVSKCPTGVARLMLLACLVVEIIQHWILGICRHTMTLHPVKVIETSMNMYAMYRSTAMSSLNVILSDILEVKK